MSDAAHARTAGDARGLAGRAGAGASPTAASAAPSRGRVRAGAWLAAAAFATAVAHAAPAPPAPGAVAIGACRDGAPHGPYEVRAPDGSVLVTGAFARGRRTGTFLFWAAGGARTALVPYEDDARVGTAALWYAPVGNRTEPQRRLEATFAAAVLHGATRSWYANGNPRTESRYDRGRLADVRGWAEAGAPLSESEARSLAESDATDLAERLAVLERWVAQTPPPCTTPRR